MVRFLRSGTIVVLACAGLAVAGCTRLFDDGTKDKIEKAEKKVATGDFAAAVSLYEATLDGTAKSADTHYKIALIYSDKLKQPLDAIHHLDRYVELAPTGSRAKDAKALKKQDQNGLLSTLTKGAPATQSDANRLRDENKRLADRNAELLRTIAEARAQKATATTGKDRLEKAPILPGSRTYTVRKGDTFAKISRALFKTPGRATTIQKLNYPGATKTPTIKPGEVLMVPTK